MATPLAGLEEGVLAKVLGYQLAQATVLASSVFAKSVAAGFELRPVEFTVLLLIEHNPDVAATQLARALAMTPPNIKAWVDKLEHRGLVQRSSHDTDRRQLRLRTTSAGRTLARRAAEAVLAQEELALAALTSAERAMLLELLHKAARGRARR